MAKINLSFEKRRDIFLYMTRIENLFINEFLPDAPGEYVKVYLYGQMYAQYDQPVDSSTIAKQLGLTEAEVDEAWIYWESRGIVKTSRTYDEDGEETLTIYFVRQIELLYGKPEDDGTAAEAQFDGGSEAASAEAAEEVPHYVSIDNMEFDEVMSSKIIDNKLRAIYRKYQDVTGRTISRQETSKIQDAIQVYGIEPAIFEYSIDYCADLEKYSIDYIFKVALRWTEDGCRSVEEVRKLLEKHSLRNSWYTKIFKALGFNRLPAPADREIMDRWFDVMNCSIAEVLDACKAAGGIREPNLRYVNKVLENRRLERGGINTRAMYNNESGVSAPGGNSDEESPVSRKVLSDYFEYIRTESENTRSERIEEVKEKIPGMKRLFERETEVNMKFLRIRPDSSNLDERQRLRVERQEIESEKKDMLRKNGYPSDYLTRQYKCRYCKDTGYTDEGMVCRCCKERAKEAFEWYTEKNS